MVAEAIDSPVRFALLSPQIPDLVANTNPPIRQDAQDPGFLVNYARRFPSQPTEMQETLRFYAHRLRLCFGTAQSDLVSAKFLPAEASIGRTRPTSTTSPSCGGQRIH